MTDTGKWAWIKNSRKRLFWDLLEYHKEDILFLFWEDLTLVQKWKIRNKKGSYAISGKCSEDGYIWYGLTIFSKYGKDFEIVKSWK